MAVDLSFLNSGLQDPLPQGVPADPTYLAFLRGAGFDRTAAWTTAIKQIQALKSNYSTAVSREPENLRQAVEGTDQGYLSHGGWANGRRLEELARDRVASQQRLQDLATAESTGISDVHTNLTQTLSGLRRQNLDQIGALQTRHDAQSNQDKYIAAIENIARQNAAGGGGGVYGGTLPSGPAPSAPPPPLSPAQQLANLTPAQADAFNAWIRAQAVARIVKNPGQYAPAGIGAQPGAPQLQPNGSFGPRGPMGPG